MHSPLVRLATITLLALAACNEPEMGFKPICAAEATELIDLGQLELGMTCDELCPLGCGTCEPEYEYDGHVGERHTDPECEGLADDIEPDGQFIVSCEDPIFTELPPAGSYFTCCCYSELADPPAPRPD